VYCTYANFEAGMVLEAWATGWLALQE